MPGRLLARPDAVHVASLSHNGIGDVFHGTRVTAPISATNNATTAVMSPFHLRKSYALARWWWQLGATVGTNYVEAGIYDGDFQLVAASPRVLHAGTANTLQYQTPGIHGTHMLSVTSVTDASQYAMGSAVTLKAGVLYLMAVENSKASAADVVSSIDSATAGYPTFTSRSSTTFNTSTADSVSIWSAVPTADWTGTLRVNFSATQTGCIAALSAFRGVDTATNDGIVQNQVGTGTSTTPLATLSAYGSADNVGYAAFGQAAAATGAPTSATTFELSDSTASSPNKGLQTVYTFNDTSMDETITSAAWGACAVEIESLGTGAITIPPMSGWLALWVSGTTATFFIAASQRQVQHVFRAAGSLTSGLSETLTTFSGAAQAISFGFTSRSTP